MQKRAEIPKFRINYYIDGKGGIGKNVASKALAKSLYPELSDDDLYFEVGGNNVSFDGYDGQPVIIWNDKRASPVERSPRWKHPYISHSHSRSYAGNDKAPLAVKRVSFWN